MEKNIKMEAISGRAMMAIEEGKKTLKDRGLAIVPIEPTEEMYREMNAYTNVYFTGCTEDDYPTLKTLYQAAIKAAPEQN